MLQSFKMWLFLSWLACAEVRVAITVDDLPVHGPVPSGVTRLAVAQKMLSAFKKHRVGEVFGFINAGRVGPDVLRAWRNAGYPLGNHTCDHPDLNRVSIEEFKKQIDQNEPVLSEMNGLVPWHYFRYPFLREGDSLEKRNAIRGYLAEKGYRVAQVTIDFEDWSWNAPYVRCLEQGDRKKIEWLETSYLQNAQDMLARAETASRALFGRSMAHVLLLHVGVFDAEMIERLLARYEAAGVRFIPLAEALRDPVYSLDPAIVGRYGSEFTFQVMKARGLRVTDLGLEVYKHYPEKELKEACM